MCVLLGSCSSCCNAINNFYQTIMGKVGNDLFLIVIPVLGFFIDFFLSGHLRFL